MVTNEPKINRIIPMKNQLGLSILSNYLILKKMNHG